MLTVEHMYRFESQGENIYHKALTSGNVFTLSAVKGRLPSSNSDSAALKVQWHQENVEVQHSQLHLSQQSIKFLDPTYSHHALMSGHPQKLSIPCLLRVFNAYN